MQTVLYAALQTEGHCRHHCWGRCRGHCRQPCRQHCRIHQGVPRAPHFARTMATRACNQTLAPQFNHKICYLSGGFVVGLWWVCVATLWWGCGGCVGLYPTTPALRSGDTPSLPPSSHSAHSVVPAAQRNAISATQCNLTPHNDA